MARSAVGRLTIDLNALKQNYRFLKNKVNAACHVSAVVKADAYGLGVKKVARALFDEGCRHFFVSSPREGVTLRQYAPEGSIYILNGYYTKHYQAYLEHRLIPVIGSFGEATTLNDTAKELDQKLPVAINFNTGMNRLGFSLAGTKTLLADLSFLNNLDIKLVLSHLASADDPNDPITEDQYDRFCTIATFFPKTMKSLANSFGTFLDPKYHFDLIRPGMALYGLNPTPHKSNPMKSVVKLKVPVIRLRDVIAGEGIGYNTTHTFEKDGQIAVVSAGYADGIFRALSNKGFFYWGDCPCPIRGRVSMDLITVDISHLPETKRPKPGDFFQVLGDNQSVDDLAYAGKTIGYEILTALGERYRRRYIG